MRTFRSLRHRNYRLYFFGQMISLIGSWMQMTVLMWLAFDLTHESRWPAYLMIAQIGPTLLLGAWAGGLADRVVKRKLIVVTQIAFLTIATAMTCLLYFGSVTIGMILILVTLQGIIQAIDLPTRLAFVPDLVSRDDLGNAVALNSLLFNVARAIGPAIAGIFLSQGMPALCILLNTLSYFAVLAALLSMSVLEDRHLQPRDESAPITGFAVLRKQPNLLLIVLVAGMLSITAWPLQSLLPEYSRLVLLVGEGGYSTLLSSVGVGALLAALTTATFGTDTRRGKLLLLAMILVVFAFIGLTAFRTLTLAAICCGTFGFGMILFFSNGQTMVQLGTLDQHRGKVMGVWAMMLSGGVPIGNLIWGHAPQWIGVPATLAIQGSALALIVVLLVLRSRGLYHTGVANDSSFRAN